MGDLTKRAQNAQQDQVSLIVGGIEDAARRVLSKSVDPQRYLDGVALALRADPRLAQCSRDSIIGALMLSAQLGIVPGRPHGRAALINRGGKCVLELEYRGAMEIVQRIPQVNHVAAGTVHKNDRFVVRHGDGATFFHEEAGFDRGPAIGYYAWVSFNDGRPSRVYTIDVAEAEHIRDTYSDAYKRAEKNGKRDSAWHREFDKMAQKTAIKRLCSVLALPLADAQEIELAQRYDGVSVEYRGGEFREIEVPEEPAPKQIAAPAPSPSPSKEAPVSPQFDRSAAVDLLMEDTKRAVEIYKIEGPEIGRLTGWDGTRESAEAMDAQSLSDTRDVVTALMERAQN